MPLWWLADDVTARLREVLPEPVSAGTPLRVREGVDWRKSPAHRRRADNYQQGRHDAYADTWAGPAGFGDRPWLHGNVAELRPQPRGPPGDDRCAPRCCGDRHQLL